MAQDPVPPLKKVRFGQFRCAQGTEEKAQASPESSLEWKQSSCARTRPRHVSPRVVRPIFEVVRLRTRNRTENLVSWNRYPFRCILDSMSELTQVHPEIEPDGDAATERFLPVIDNDLRKLAKSGLAHEDLNHTLQATAQVHKEYLRLFDVEELPLLSSKAHFLARRREAKAEGSDDPVLTYSN